MIRVLDTWRDQTQTRVVLDVLRVLDAGHTGPEVRIVVTERRQGGLIVEVKTSRPDLVVVRRGARRDLALATDLVLLRRR